MIQRCVYIEGLGRVHVLADDRWRIGLKRWRMECAMLDAFDWKDEIAGGLAAHDILTGRATNPRRILWSVRYTERAPA